MWEEITEAIKEIWPFIRIIINQKGLLEKAQEGVETITRQLEDMPETAFDIIKFLNSKDGCELEELRINDRTTMILEVKKVITKKIITLQLQEKEIKKILDAQIILPLRYSNWVANLVPVRKKNGEIILLCGL